MYGAGQAPASATTHTAGVILPNAADTTPTGEVAQLLGFPGRFQVGRAGYSSPAASQVHQRAANGLDGIDPFQCNPGRDRLSSVNFRG